MATEFEIDKRYKKAIAFGAHLWSHGVGSDQLDRIGAQHWRNLGAAIGHNPPNGPETITAIRYVMQTFEKVVADRIAEQAAKEKTA